MIPVKDAADVLGLSAVRLKQILKEDHLAFARSKNGYISVSHETLRDMMKSRGIRYKPTVATFGIEKGGAGKTTLTLLFALYASRIRGVKVAVLDVDPEASATQFLALESFDIAKSGTILEVFQHNRQIIDFLQPSRFTGVDFLPCRALSRRVDRFIADANPKKFLRQKMHGLTDMYDVILWDVPPSFSQLVAGAYLSSDIVVCLVNSDVFSLESLILTKEDITEMAERFEARKPEIRVLRNRFSEQRRNARESHAELQRDFPDELLPFQIKESAVIANAINDGMSPFEGRGNGELKAVFGDLFESLLKPVGGGLNA